ncbi:DUF1640-domain-containing protein [Gongronella butleri]|nr:DUF1640-domain-containing protein [Gongronella butleri]
MPPLCRHVRSETTTTAAATPQHHFDSYKLVQRLERNNFTRQQSLAVMRALQQALAESITSLTEHTVQKTEYDKATNKRRMIYTVAVDFAQLRSEVQCIESTDHRVIRTENERLLAEMKLLQQQLNQEILGIHGHARVEMYLERGRFRDENSQQKIKINETDARIESEVSNIRIQMESIKIQILQYILGTLTGGGALFLAYLRMFR